MHAEYDFSEDTKGSLLVHLVYQGDKKLFSEIPNSFTGKKFDSIFLPDKKAFVISLGERDKIQLEYYRRAAARACKAASFYKIPEVHFSVQGLSAEHCVALLEGGYLANYSFDKYKQEAERPMRVKKFTFPPYAKKFSEFIHAAAVACRNVFIVRDLVSDNSDVVTPEFLERVAKGISRKARLKIDVLHERELKKLGMNLILNVGKAGSAAPRLIAIEYHGNPSSKEKVLFVGKGVCFDTGGLNIKTGDYMLGMRMDMAGAATVLGIMKTAAELKLKKNIVGIMVCVENLVDTSAYRPGDIIKSYSGKTVENLNTDAEGRLILADALAYGAKKYTPKVIVEFSTLTGAIVRALGEHAAGMMSTSKEFGEKMFDAGQTTYERVWEMPMWEEYLDEVTGERSDFRSLGKSGNNGAIFGGAFLSKFTDPVPFIHLDVAGTAMICEPKDYMPKDGTGLGLRLAIEFLKRI